MIERNLLYSLILSIINSWFV